MKIKQNPSWVTPTMVAQGITITVFDYVLGNKKILNVGKLSVNEVFLIRTVIGESFEDTKTFMEWIKPFRAIGKKNISEELLQVVFAAIADESIGSIAKEVFMKYLPLKYAVRLCASFHECSVLLDKKTKSIADKLFIFQRIRDLSAQEKFNKDTLLSYYKITTKYPAEHSFAEALLNTYYLDHPEDAEYFSGLSDAQIRGVCKNIETSVKKFGVDLIFSFYRKNNFNPIILPVVLKTLSDERKNESALKRLIFWIRQNVRGSQCDTAAAKKGIFPVFAYMLKELEFDLIEEFNGRNEFLLFLPPYEEKNEDLQLVLDKLFDSYKNYEYGLLTEDFIAVYEYLGRKGNEWVNLYIDSIGKHDYKCFAHAIQIFVLYDMEQVLTRTIEVCVRNPEINIEDLTQFLDWLKKKKPVLYTTAINTFLNADQMNTQWEKAKKYSVTGYMKLAVHFI